MQDHIMFYLFFYMSKRIIWMDMNRIGLASQMRNIVKG